MISRSVSRRCLLTVVSSVVLSVTVCGLATGTVAMASSPPAEPAGPSFIEGLLQALGLLPPPAAGPGLAVGAPAPSVATVTPAPRPAAVTRKGSRPAAPGKGSRPAAARPASRYRDRRARHRVPVPRGMTSPLMVRIPAIGVDAPIIPLAGSPDGYIGVPALSQAQAVAWYRNGAIPGQPGNALLLGHVDTYVGPAVFYSLYQLRRGNDVYVSFGPRDEQRFTVRSVLEVPKASYGGGSLFSPTRQRRLWLVTCGGAFSEVTHSYLDNIIVSARWAGSRA